MNDTVRDHRGRAAAIGRVYLLAVALSVATVALLIGALDGHHPTIPAPWWVALLIGLGFALSERYVFHIEYRREAISFSLSEVPTALALAFLGPLAAVAVRVIASLVVHTLTLRPTFYKLVFNGALFAFETALAFATVRAFTSGAAAHDDRFLVAVAVACAGATLFGSLMVSLAIASFEGDPIAHLASELRTNVVTSPVGAVTAAVAVAPALLRIELVALSVVPVVAVWLVMLQHGRLGQRHRDLEALHGFAGTVGRSLDLADVARSALDEAMRLLRARRGTLSVLDEHGCPVLVLGAGPETATSITEPVDSPGHIVLPIRDGRGTVGSMVLTDREGAAEFFDADDRRRAATLADQLAVSLRNALLHAEMERAALHDTLTGEPNRLAFEHAVRDAIATIRPDECVAVLMLDLDQFKEVNDTLGHHVGDQVLVAFARRMRGLLDPADVLARFGGDEFAVLLRRPTLPAVRAVAEQLVAEAHGALEMGDYDLVVAVSIGVAVIVEQDHDPAPVLRRADIAMYTAKKQRTGVELYREEIDRRTPARLSLLGDLRDALEQGSLEVHYQPKVDLMSSTVTGAEALVRWRHASRGWISPIEFVGVAEETGLIRQLTDQVMSAAIDCARGWADRGYDLDVSVNLSTLDLLDELLPERIAHRLERAGLDPPRLTLEITESALMVDTPRSMSTVERLHALGVRLSLDDFGTGYSSLSYLRQLPVSELKIDRSFVSNLVLDAQDEVIVRSTIDLGHNLGLQVVAEGIENGPTIERLHALGCDLGQGYGISRPLSSELLDRWLATTEYVVPRRRAGELVPTKG